MITELKPTTLFAIDVPIDADRYKISALNFLCFKTPLINCWVPEVGFDFEFKIIGEVVKNKIGFDVEPYVDKYNDGSYRYYVVKRTFMPDTETCFICITKEESFYSLLAANGLYFENPKGIKPVFIYSDYDFGGDGISESTQNSIEADFDNRTSEWQSFEDKLIKEKLLIIEKIK